MNSNYYFKNKKRCHTIELKEKKSYTYRNIGCQTGNQGSCDSIWNRGVGTLCFLSCGSNDVKADEGIETCGCTLQNLKVKKVPILKFYHTPYLLKQIQHPITGQQNS